MSLLTLARDLRRRKARERSGLFVAEGVRTVEDLLRSPLAIRGALVGPQLDSGPRGEAVRQSLVARGVEVLDVDEREFDSAAETESPQGVLAVAAVPARSWSAVAGDRPVRVLVLDAVQDPGNVGTMVRTAAALGAAATVALPGTVDLWSAKVVRSAMGAHFSHAAFATTWDDLDRWRTAGRVAIWGADAGGSPLTAVGETPGRLALVVGNEGSGLTAAARERIEKMVALPLAGLDSLNVAVAAGILLYELRSPIQADR